MKQAYPVLLIPGSDFGYVVFIPDFQANTEGKDIPNALYMARDAIGLLGISMQDDGEELPAPSQLSEIKKETQEDIITLVDVDFDEYRKKNDLRTVKKNCTIPAWIEYEASKAGVNFSAVLKNAIKQELHLESR